MAPYHIPVLLRQSIDLLMTDDQGVYVDVTYGGGGHAQEILNRLSVNGRLVGMDRDPDALSGELKDERLDLIYGNFRYVAKYLRTIGLTKVDGLIADIGVSSHQFDDRSRGFSFQGTERLDMRMNPMAEFDAVKLLAQYREEELLYIFSQFGEVRNAKTLVRQLVRQRAIRPIETNGDLLTAIEPCIRGNRIKYLARIYQAIRIAVNDELGALRSMLEQCKEILKPGAVVVVISYHSLEDRIVKNFFRDPANNLKVLTRKPIVADEVEIKANNRARSAKLRAAQMKEA